MAYYLVTGGAGFIGSHVVERLLGNGHRVRVLDNFSTGRKENLEFSSTSVDSSLLEVVEGDLRDLEVVTKSASGVGGVFHFGAAPSVVRSVEDPVTTSAVNIMGTLNLLVAARDQGAERVVFSSSASVYGSNADGRRILSEDEVGAPLSPYALSKLTGERYMGLFSHLYGLKTVTLRYFNVFGPRQNPMGEYAAVIPRFVKFALEGKALPVFGDGHQTRDFTYVENVVEATVLAMESPVEGGEVFNVAGGQPISILKMVEVLEEIFNQKLEVTNMPPRRGDVRHSSADIELSKTRLGYKPVVPFAEGLKYTVSVFRAKADEGP
jgi:UDP-glucose 4-epimerase